MAAQELILEDQNVQLVIQNMGMEKMHVSLYKKENLKKTDQTVLFPGRKGWHLTDTEAIAEQCKVAEEHKKKDANTQCQKVMAKDKKASHKKLEEHWKQVGIEHTKAVAAWTVECERLWAEGVRPANLPAKPKKPLKALLAVEQAEDDRDLSPSWIVKAMMRQDGGGQSGGVGEMSRDHEAHLQLF